jgi:hypothetical protein
MPTCFLIWRWLFRRRTKRAFGLFINSKTNIMTAMRPPKERTFSGAMRSLLQVWTVSFAALLSSTVLADPPPVPATATTPPAPDPRLKEVPLPAQNGWSAFLVLDNAPTGVWTVEAFDVFAQHGAPEIVGLDDLGRAHICVSYSDKWTPTTVISDGKWLGGLAHGDEGRQRDVV